MNAALFSTSKYVFMTAPSRLHSMLFVILILICLQFAHVLLYCHVPDCSHVGQLIYPRFFRSN